VDDRGAGREGREAERLSHPREQCPARQDGPLLWDSGKVASDATFDIAYAGPALDLAPALLVAGRGLGSRRGQAHPRPAPAGGRWACWSPGPPAGWKPRPEAMREERLEGVHWVWGETDDAKPRRFRWRFDLPADAVSATVTRLAPRTA
jgi:alpha-L-rhamnosidase